MEFKKILTERYSCRAFSDKAIGKDALGAVLEAGRLAPTAKNLQEQRIYVVSSEEGLKKIDAATPCRYGAPVCLVVAYDKNNTFTYPGGRLDSGAEDATIVATQMMLAATDEGLCSCWLNFFNPDDLRVSLGLPENEEIVMILDLGYSADGKDAPPKMRKDISATVSYI